MTLNPHLTVYEAIIRVDDSLQERVEIHAKNTDEVRKRLNATYGKGHHFSIISIMKKKGIKLKPNLRVYKAIIWVGDNPTDFGGTNSSEHLEILAKNGDDARRQLEAKYSKDHRFSIRNEEEFHKPR